MQPDVAQPGDVHAAGLPPLLGVQVSPAAEHALVYCWRPDEVVSHVVRLSAAHDVPAAEQAVVVATQAVAPRLPVEHIEPVAHDSVSIPRFVDVSVATHSYALEPEQWVEPSVGSLHDERSLQPAPVSPEVE